jgi:hypothetical protein
MTETCPRCPRRPRTHADQRKYNERAGTPNGAPVAGVPKASRAVVTADSTRGCGPNSLASLVHARRGHLRHDIIYAGPVPMPAHVAEAMGEDAGGARSSLGSGGSTIESRVGRRRVGASYLPVSIAKGTYLAGESAVPGADDGYRAHVSLGYINAAGSAAPIIQGPALRRVHPAPAAVTVRAASLIVLDRDQKVYRWRTVEDVPLGR